jgi:adenylate cyclase class IV
MVDRRYDRDGTLLMLDHVLRLRELTAPGELPRYLVSWKGPTGVTAEGYKSRTELEYQLQPFGAPPAELFERLGYREVQRIERYVEYYRLAGAEVRLEWYPRMDVLVELEGEPEAIEAALPDIGIARNEWLADPLPVFAARYAERTGVAAALSVEELGGGVPSWESR